MSTQRTRSFRRKNRGNATASVLAVVVMMLVFSSSSTRSSSSRLAVHGHPFRTVSLAVVKDLRGGDQTNSGISSSSSQPAVTYASPLAPPIPPPAPPAQQEQQEEQEQQQEEQEQQQQVAEEKKELDEGSEAVPKASISVSHGHAHAHVHADAHHHAEELMSGPTAVANVLADLCPHGMLPIAFGMAAGGGTGPVLATIILFIFGALSWYSLVSFARAADVVLVKNHQNEDGSPALAAPGESLSAVWERTLPHGKFTTYIPDLGCVFLTIGCLLFYSAFIGDLFGSLVSGMTALPNVLRKRWSVLLLLHAVPILPLCLKRDLSALKYSSMTGLVGILYTIFFVGKRLLDGSYAAGGKFYNLMPVKLQPAALSNFPSKARATVMAASAVVAAEVAETVAERSSWGYLADIPLFHAGKGLLTLMNMCCVAYACHYNAVKYYMELKHRTVRNLMTVMAAGLGGTATVFLSMMLLGYATFGAHAQALLLNNYHDSQDVMATIARAFTGVAIISGYALMFAGLKAALFSLLKMDRPSPAKEAAVRRQQNIISAVLVATIATAACFVTEHELATVIGIVGSVFGSVVIYMFPAIINNSLLKLKDAQGNLLAQPFFRGEAIFNNLMIVFGIVFAVLGTWISLAGEESH